MCTLDRQVTLAVDVIIPAYRERPVALAATIESCLNQTYPVSQVYVVDDASPSPVTLPSLGEAAGRVHLLRLPENKGAATARNAGLVRSSASLSWCLNSEIVPAPDWLETCVNYLSVHPDVGACFTSMVPQSPDRLWTQWRMRFMELRYEGPSGPATFAPGHSVLFRREAVQKVGGYDTLQRNNEDSDICVRMRDAGWETHYVASSSVLSLQQDTFGGLSSKLLFRSNWFSPESYSLPRVFLDQSRWFAERMGRNIVRGRFQLVPLDVALWGGALTVACRRVLAERRDRLQGRK